MSQKKREEISTLLYLGQRLRNYFKIPDAIAGDVFSISSFLFHQ
ncbi:hypothetical protein STFR1_50392 [Bacillus vallismortis]